MRRFPDLKTCRHIPADNAVEPLEFNVPRLYLTDQHSASDVDPHELRDDLVRDGHGKADGADLARMAVRHYPYFRAQRKIVVADRLYLVSCVIFDVRCVYDRISKISFYSVHEFSFRFSKRHANKALLKAYGYGSRWK